MKSKIKIIHVVHNFLNGGIEGFLYYLVKEQVNNPSLEVSILCCSDKNNIVNDRILGLDVKIHYINVKPFDFNPKKILKARKILNNYDVVNFHTFLPIFIFSLLGTKPKKVFTVHSAGSILRNNSILNKIKNFLFSKFLSHGVNMIIHNSFYTQSFWDKKGVKNNNNIVIYNGVYFNTKYNPDQVYKSYPDFKDKIIIGTTCRLIKWKRVDLLIDMFSENIHKFPPNVILVVVGDGPEYDNLKVKVESKGLNDRVFLLGYKFNITDYQSVMDVCVFVSAQEPFGLVSVECLNLGKSVFVLSDSGGAVEIVQGLSSFYVSDSIYDLGNKVLKELNKPNTSKNQKIEYSKKFSTVNAERNYFYAYQKLVV